MVPSERLIREAHSLKGKFVGIVPPMAFHDMAAVKRFLLLFDRLALDLGSSGMSHAEGLAIKNARREIDWLSQEKMLTTLTGLSAGAGPVRSAPTIIGGNFLEAGVRGSSYALARVGAIAKLASGSSLRLTAAELRSNFGIDAIAAPTSAQVQDADAPAGREAVVRLTLNEFPLVGEGTPWSSIQTFRADANARSQFPRLKVWINKISKGGLTEFEVSDELRGLIEEYESSMKIHEMKSDKGVLEVAVTTTAEIAESLLRFKPSKAAKAIFKATDYKLKLLEEEKKTVGREIAYILSARSAFSN